MKKFFKYLFSIIAILLVAVLAFFIVFIAYFATEELIYSVNRKENKIHKLSDNQIIAWAYDSINDTEETEVYSELYKELLINRDISEDKMAEKSGSEYKLKYENCRTYYSVYYIATLLSDNNFDEFKEVFPTVYSRLKDYEKDEFYASVLIVLCDKTKDDNDSYLSCYNFIKDYYNENYLEDNADRLYFSTFLYFYSATIEDADYSAQKDEMMQVINATGTNYDSYFDKMRYHYSTNLILSNSLDRFDRSVLRNNKPEDNSNWLSFLQIETFNEITDIDSSNLSKKQKDQIAATLIKLRDTTPDRSERDMKMLNSTINVFAKDYDSAEENAD